MMQANGWNDHRMFKGSFGLERTQTLLHRRKEIEEYLILMQSPRHICTMPFTNQIPNLIMQRICL